MAYILNLDTATEICSVALADDDHLLALRETHDKRSHAGTLLPFIEEILNECHLAPTDLQAVAISMGPGSYTGLRIGTSTAKGLCYALQIPLIAIPTLQIIAAGAQREQKGSSQNTIYIPMLDARRMEVYTCMYDHNLQSLSDVQALIVNETYLASPQPEATLIFCGNGVDKCEDWCAKHPNALIDKSLLSARNMLSLSAQKFAQQQFEDMAYFEPFYLKEYIAAKPHVKGLV